MKIKTLLNLIIAFSAIAFVACEEDMNSIGSTIQPGGDDIYVGADTVHLTAETVSFQDSVYARTIFGMLGEYEELGFGGVKSDYMCEFFCPEKTKFKDNVQSIDSIILSTGFTNFIGDSISPMGLSVYKLENPLKANFFTNVDPSAYCGTNPEVLGQNIFTVASSPIDTVLNKIRYREIRTKLKKSMAQDFYQEYLDSNGETFLNSDKLKKFFKGIYVTTTFGTGTLLNVDYTDFTIYYTHNVRKVDNSGDSLVHARFRLGVTPEIIQLNKVKNDISDMSDNVPGKKKRTFMKTPAGVYTQLTIPLNDILRRAGKDKVINGASFKLKGFTEEEEKSKLRQPTYVLLINKDSLPNFFLKRKLHDSRTSFLLSRDATNSYNFGNVSGIINHYAEHYKNSAVVPDLKYLVIPVSVSAFVSNNSGQSVTTITEIYNQMHPTLAVLRTDEANMTMPLVFSKYNKAE